MKIYIDSDFKCHTANPEGAFREFDAVFFNGKCPTFIEGYRYVPAGESWTSPEGTAFPGEMIAPWKPYEELDTAQRNYEQQLIADMETALHTLGVTLDG